MRVCIYFILCVNICVGDLFHERVKRDNGGAFEDSGGPVAQESSSDASGQEVDPQLQKIIASLDPCEVKARNSSLEEIIKEKIRTNTLPKKLDGIKSRLPFDKATTPTPVLNGQQNVSLEEHFRRFLAKFNRTYLTKNDENIAIEKFKENFKFLGELAARRVSPFDASFSLTKFSDLDFATFQNSHTGIMPALTNEKPLTISPSLIVKRNCQKMNWTSLDVVPEVRKQDKCGCCYAMSTADLVASQYKIDQQSFNSSIKLSAQWISDCMPQPAGFHCKGGRPVKVLEALAKHRKWKIPSENCYPYVDKNQTCGYSRNCTQSPEIKIRWGKMADLRGPNEKDLMAALLQHGPLVAIVGVSKSWQLYNGTGILRPYQCSEEQNHAVLITGYDYTGCVPNYIIKNSWGTDWGGRGYIKLEAGKNTCGVARSVVFTCTKDKCGSDPIKYVLSTVQHPECHSKF